MSNSGERVSALFAFVFSFFGVVCTWAIFDLRSLVVGVMVSLGVATMAAVVVGALSLRDSRRDRHTS